jgi:hypothetical protein
MRARPFLTRRGFLKSLGVSTAVAPFVPLLNASGQESTKPRRLLLVYTPDGTADSDSSAGPIDWKPPGTETDFRFHEIHAKLEPLKSKILLPWGLKMSAAGAGEQHAYGSAGMWTGARLKDPGNGADFDGGNGHRTGWGSGPSVDQIVAAAFGPGMPYERAANDPMPETRFRTVELGSQCGNPNSVTRTIYKGDDQPLHPETNPQAAFDRLFMGVMPSTGEPPMEDPAAAQRRLEQKGIIDLVKGDLAKLRTKVSAEEYGKIDAHLEGLMAIEQRVTAMPPAPVAGCTLPARPAASTRANNANFPTEVAAVLGMVPHIFACDLTRVMSVQLSCGFSNVTHTWLGHSAAHHTLSHQNADNRALLMAIDDWYCQQVATMLTAMDAIDEGGTSLLDNTLVVWARELGSTSHAMRPWCVVLAGGAAMGLRTGRFIDVNNQPSAKLLVSICQMMGLTSQTGVGNIDVDSGPLLGLV